MFGATYFGERWFGGFPGLLTYPAAVAQAVRTINTTTLRTDTVYTLALAQRTTYEVTIRNG